MKTTNNSARNNYNCTAPLLFIIVIFLLACIATSCQTTAKTYNHFKPTKKPTSYYNKKKVNGFVKAKTLKKCYAYE